jgi:atrial natriuretic peptide receptor B
MDKKMDEFDVYKVETISDSYLVASGLPKKNGDRHATEICSMALTLNAACKAIERPDRKSRSIEIKAGIHTGNISSVLKDQWIIHFVMCLHRSHCGRDRRY